MIDNTINNDMTTGGATGTLLAGRYRVVRLHGQSEMRLTICAFDCSRMKVDIKGAFDCSLWYDV